VFVLSRARRVHRPGEVEIMPTGIIVGDRRPSVPSLSVATISPGEWAGRKIRMDVSAPFAFHKASKPAKGL